MLSELQPQSLNDLKTSPILQQTTYWGVVKSMQGWKAIAFQLQVNTGENVFKEDLLLVTREVGDGAQIAYVPYGPKNLPDEERRGQYLEELSESLRSFLPKSCMLIRYDLPWESPWSDESDCTDEEGKWVGPPEARIQEFRMNFGTNNWNLRKSPTDILPSSTFFIDLKNYEDRLLSNMKSKTRYNIKLAGRKGVTVKEVGKEKMGDMYDLYCETAQRNGLTCNSVHYFESLIEAKRVNTAPETKVKMLMAEVEDQPIAGMFMVKSGSRATYLYGASSSKCRNYMGAYALQWKAILDAKKEGCTHYDMFGVSQRPDPSHPMYGLYRFKSGFGGEILHRQGCWDYPLDESQYNRYRATEATFTGYHSN